MSCSSAGRAHVLDAVGRADRARAAMRRGIDRHAIAVVLGVGVLRDEVAQDHQHAVVGLAQLADLRVLALVERAHQVAGDDEQPPQTVMSSHCEAGRQPAMPGRRPSSTRCGTSAAARRAGRWQRGQRRVPPAVEIRRAERRQHVEAEHHPLRRAPGSAAGDAEKRQEDPQLLVHPFDLAELHPSHST